MNKIATSPNRAYLASCLRYSAQIQPNGWTSDTLRTLYDIPSLRYGKGKFNKTPNVRED